MPISDSSTPAPKNPDAMAGRLAHLDQVIAFSLEQRKASGQPPEPKHRAYYRANREKCIARQQAYHKANPHKRKEIDLKRAYGITLSDFAQMMKQQDDRCLICKTRFGPGKQLEPNIDHCHKTGKIRGILCGGCNRGIGYMQDNPVILRAAIRYLKAHQSEPTIDTSDKPNDNRT